MSNLIFHQATQKVKVLQWTEKLCRCLEQQYRDYSVRSIVNNQNKADKPDPYLQEKINQIESGEDDRISFFIENGRKRPCSVPLWQTLTFV